MIRLRWLRFIGADESVEISVGVSASFADKRAIPAFPERPEHAVAAHFVIACRAIVSQRSVAAAVAENFSELARFQALSVNLNHCVPASFFF